VKISLEWVTDPEQGKSSDRIATFSFWTIKASDARRITAAEMKYTRRTAGYTWTDYKTNEQIAKELKNDIIFGQITGIQEKLDTTCK